MNKVGILISHTLARLRGLNTVLVTTSGLIILTIMVIISYEVIMRYFFDAPTSWVVEISVYLMIAGLFIPQAYVQQTEQHVRMDWLYQKLPKRAQSILDLSSWVIGLCVWAVFGWNALHYALKARRDGWTSGTSLDAPLWPVLITIAFGALLLCLQLIITIRMTVSSLFPNEESIN